MTTEQMLRATINACVFIFTIAATVAISIWIIRLFAFGP